MATTKAEARAKTTEEYIEFTRRLYRLMGNEEHVGETYMSVAKAIDVPSWRMINLKATLEEIGALDAKVVYNPLVDGKRRMGRMAIWKLVKPEEEAIALIREWDKKGVSWEYEARPGYVVKAPFRSKKAPEPKPEPEPTVTLATKDTEEVRAIAGPEPTNPFASLSALRKDEPAALIEAAKQYANRTQAVEKEYQSLVTMGLAVDREKFMEAISLPRDEFLETICLVLPIITSLQAKNESLLNQLNAAREKTRDYAEIKANYERLQKRWNERVAERVRESA